jgi:2'-5' RNA ligase
MYLAVEATPSLVELKKKVLETFPEYPDQHLHQFIPHITLKRWQRYEFEALKLKTSLMPFLPTSMEVGRLNLFEAQKDELNRKYHVIW